jgi:hypothetical protein
LAFNEEDIRLVLSGEVDSRTKGSAGHPVESHPLYHLQRVYCAYCAKPGGYVSIDSSKYIAPINVVHVCDNCHLAVGELPLERLPESAEVKL